MSRDEQTTTDAGVVVRRLFDLFNEGDLGAASALASDDFEYRTTLWANRFVAGLGFGNG